MGTSTAGKKCPICGRWISTEAPRFASRRGLGARDVLQREFLAHLRTYRPDYLQWSRPFQLFGAAPIVSGLSLALVAALTRIVVLLLLGIPRHSEHPCSSFTAESSRLSRTTGTLSIPSPRRHEVIGFKKSRLGRSCPGQNVCFTFGVLRQPWRREPRTPRARTPCPKAPNRLRQLQ